MSRNKEGTRSPLESFCWEQLEKAGIEFEYEKSYELFPPFTFNGVSIEKTTKKKELHIKRNQHLDIKFTPDFVGKEWVLEVKGHRTADFDLRWKIFKNHIKERGYLLLLPMNQREVMVSVNILKKWIQGDRTWSNERILQEYAVIKQSPKKHPKSKVVQVKKGEAGLVRKRGLHSPSRRQRSRLPIN